MAVPAMSSIIAASSAARAAKNNSQEETRRKKTDSKKPSAKMPSMSKPAEKKSKNPSKTKPFNVRPIKPSEIIKDKPKAKTTKPSGRATKEDIKNLKPKGTPTSKKTLTGPAAVAELKKQVSKAGVKKSEMKQKEAIDKKYPGLYKKSK